MAHKLHKCKGVPTDGQDELKRVDVFCKNKKLREKMDDKGKEDIP